MDDRSQDLWTHGPAPLRHMLNQVSFAFTEDIIIQPRMHATGPHIRVCVKKITALEHHDGYNASIHTTMRTTWKQMLSESKLATSS